MTGETNVVVKDTKRILKPILEKSKYDVVSFVLEVQKVQSRVDQVEVNVSSIPEEEGVDKDKEEELNKGEKEIEKEDRVEDTQNPLD